MKLKGGTKGEAFSPSPFDRTYEGLKRLDPEDADAYGEAFDRTYEGLKLQLRSDMRGRNRLLTVPMRV